MMACEAVHTGSRFLASTLAHLDCQGRTIGAYGYGALADPTSNVSLALTGVLTIFVALFGVRLLLGSRLTTHGLIDDAIKVGLFLMLVTSWPAWRTLAYDLVLDGPAQLAAPIGQAAGLPGSAGDLVARLQDMDDGIVSLTMYGSGRLTGGVSAGADLGDVSSGIALADQSALGTGRATFLATVIGVGGLLSVGTGLLLALAPLMAGLVLFTPTRALFAGWLRALAFCGLASLAFRILAGVEMALVYPWLTDALAQRQFNVLTPSAPTELIVLTLAFAITMAGTLFLLARMTFLPAIAKTRVSDAASQWARPASPLPETMPTLSSAQDRPERPVQTANAMTATMRRETGLGDHLAIGTLNPSSRQAAAVSDVAGDLGLSGSGETGRSPRRTTSRMTRAGQRRDRS